MLIRVIDFETTGEPPGAAVCEVGWCDVNTPADGGPATIAEPKAMLVNPHRTMPANARGVHHISDEDLAGAPEISTGFLTLALECPHIFVAHNAKFEQQFWTGGGAGWICTRKVAMRLWPDAPDHKNQTLRYHLGIDELCLDFEPTLATPPHRAGPDAYVTAFIFVEALKLATVEQMRDWTDKPSLLPGVMRFGKHKGVSWSMAPPDYLSWIVHKSDMDEDTKFTAKHYLNAGQAPRDQGSF